MQVGDKLWCHDTRSNSRPWFDRPITGETRQSWLLGEGERYKVNKKTMLENLGAYGERRWHTEESKRAVVWLSRNRWPIAKAVEACRDEAILRQIAALLGRETEETAPQVSNGERQSG